MKDYQASLMRNRGGGVRFELRDDEGEAYAVFDIDGDERAALPPLRITKKFTGVDLCHPRVAHRIAQIKLNRDDEGGVFLELQVEGVEVLCLDVQGGDERRLPYVTRSTLVGVRGE